jgi:signal transduction histidine kinase
MMKHDSPDLEALLHQREALQRLYAEAQQAVDELRLLYETSTRISTALTLEDVVRAYLGQVAVGGRYRCNIALYEFDADGARVAVVVRGRWSPGEEIQLLEARHPYTYDALDAPLDRGETIIIRDVHSDPRVSEALRAIQRTSARPALAMIPLMVRGRRIGLVILSYAEVIDWPLDALRTYQTTAAQLATAIDSRLQQQVLINRSRQIAVLEERQRLAHELHDSVTQLIFSITLIAQSVSPAWRRSPEEGEARVARLLELSQSALAEMRALLAELRPSSGEPEISSLQAEALAAPGAVAGTLRLRSAGLVAALEGYIASVVSGIAAAGSDAPPRVTLNADSYVSQPAEYEEALYRIAQEALNNALKHARATHISITLAFLDESGDGQRGARGTMALAVRDDGRGFVGDGPPADGPGRQGMGLRSMAERAQALGGSLSVTTEPGHGTRVEAIIARLG